MQTTHNENKRKKVFLITTLLLALLLIFAFGTYSLSKYVSKDEGSGTATIAKWGYEVKVDTTDLFDKEYKKADESWATVNGEGEVVVKAATDNESNVIAPGTKGSMTISVTGNAEVAAKLAYNFGESAVPSYKISVQKAGEPEKTLTYTYSPVVLTLQKYSDNTFGTPSEDPVVTGLDKIEEKLSEQTYAPGSEVNLYYQITWEWAFTKEGDLKPNEEGEDAFTLTYDTLDTIIGIYSNQGNTGDVNYNGATYTVTKNTSMNLDLTITLEQVQTNPATDDGD